MYQESDPKGDQDKKLFIGGLNPRTDEASLQEYYGQWGEITDVVVMKDPRSQKSRCFGFVTFKEAVAVDAAQTHRPHTVDGKDVDCKRAMPKGDASPEIHASVKKIFVGGLKKDVTNQDLNEYFSKFGKVVDAQVVIAKDTNTSRGFAFVTFEDTDSVDKVILHRPHVIHESKSDVRKALSRDEMNRMKTKPPLPTSNYNNGSWNDHSNSGYVSSWDQGYNQQYQSDPYAYNNSSYGYGDYEAGQHGSAWSGAHDGFGSYQQHGYAGGPVRAAPATTQYTRPAPYASNGWQQR